MSMVATRPRDHTSAESLFNAGAHTYLKQNNFVELSADPMFLKPRAAIVVAGMKRLTEKPDCLEQFPWHTHVSDAYGPKYEQEAGLKYETRDGENKYVFQYIRGAAYSTSNRSAYGAFLSALSDLDALAREYALGIASCLDRSYGKHKPYKGTLYDRIKYGTSVTRVPLYLPLENGSCDAYPHIDRGIISIHFTATHQGLYVYLPDGSRVRINECDNNGICAFFGRKYMAATQNMNAGCPHGVKYDREIGEDRQSIVTFIHPHEVDSDVQWLLANDAAIKARERKIRL